MQRFPAAACSAALLALLGLSLLTGCGGGSSTNPSTVVAKIVLSPSTVSLNQGQVFALSAVAQNSTGGTVAADITFTSSNTSLLTVSTGGILCGGIWDSNIVVCSPVNGSAGVGQATITATSGSITATSTVYVHLKVDLVTINATTGCSTMGTAVNPTASAFNISAQGCTPSMPCDITSTVGPIAIGSNDANVVASAAGINPTFSSTTHTPSYQSGGTITGSSGQNCNLTNFSVGGSLGIDPTFRAATNSPTYQSGGSISGSGGQTCTLTDFTGVSGASAIVVLTGTNAIATGTQLIITNQGFGGTTPPTTATLSNGTATCSGTANVITRLVPTGGAGNVIGAAGTVALTGSNVIAANTPITITAEGFGAVTAPTTATLTDGTAKCSGTANVLTSLNSATGFRAQNPGQGTIYASVSGVNSVGTPFIVCPVSSIQVHGTGGTQTSFSLAPAAVQSLTADVLDTNGNAITPSLTWASSIGGLAAATTSGSNSANVTAARAGTVAITATCSNPDCNINVPAQYPLNTVTVQVTGSTSTNVYAAATNSTMLVPINTDSNLAGTAITLPNAPNSILSDLQGANLYLGSESGVMKVATSTGAVTTLTSLTGTVLAVSSDGNYLLAADTNAGKTYVYSTASSSVVYAHSIVAPAGAFTPDSKTAWFFQNTLAFADLISGANTQYTLPYTANAVAFDAEGGLGYFTGSGLIDVRSTCNTGEEQMLPAMAPTLLATLPNGTGAVAADSPNVDIVSSTNLMPGCPTMATNSVSTYNLGAGAFNAKQMFVSTDSSRVWIVSDQAQLLSFSLGTSQPINIPLIGGAVGLSGGIRNDGQQIYIGTTDGTVHRIDVGTNADQAQISVGLKDTSGNPTAPNLVVIQNH